METAVLVVLVTAIAGLAMALAIALAQNIGLKEMLRLKGKDYDDLMGRALKAETDYGYLKESITATLQRPVIAVLKDEQVEMIAKSMAMCMLQAVPPATFKH